MIKLGWAVFFLAASLLLLPFMAAAHEVRPGLLQLKETTPGQFDVLWRVPASGEQALSLTPQLAENCKTAGLPERYQDGVRSEVRSEIICPQWIERYPDQHQRS